MTSAPRPPQRLLGRYENLLVVMTYSKSRSMAGPAWAFAWAAGTDCGFGAAEVCTNPYNVNRLTLRLGEAAVDSDPYFRANARRIMATRTRPPGPCGRWAFASRIPRPIFCL